MYYKRNEPFRYTFGEPVKAFIEIINPTEEEEAMTNEGWDVYLLDLSPNGMKIVTSKDIKLTEDSKVQITFKLNETRFEANGRISWKKTQGLHQFEYGIALNNTDEMKTLLISELKAYSKKFRKK